MVLLVAFCLLAQGYAQKGTGSRAWHIAELTNSDRAAHGLPALRWSNSLAAAAQLHAERMAAENYLSHQYPGEGDVGARAARAGAHFQAIAENIATGYSDEQVEQEWMHSMPHRTNILDPKMNVIGVGVVARGDLLYVAEDFAEASEALSPGQVERQVGTLLRQQGIEPSVPQAAAAETCSSSSYPKGSRLVIRFDTGDLNELPGQVAAQIRKGDYRKASVADCPGGRQGNFTTYKVAIVLY
ncbi:MAG: CAP domain-containing protein [Acidobacteriaceae bacterium]